MAFNMFGKEKPSVRISASLSEGEKAAVTSRKQVVKKGLAKLGIPVNMDKIPNIAVLGAGGALRAMIALSGTLMELKKQNLLDCIMYLGGVSGSTWCMSTLYKTEDWSEKIEVVEKLLHQNLVQSDWDFKLAKEAVMEASEDDRYSLTDFWSYVVIHKLLNEFDENVLSAHRRSCENGRNPYPFYAAVDKKTYDKQHIGTWFEFTPHEAGVPGLGAYVDVKHFGSVFGNGQLNEEKKEKTICYLQGLWGSALGSEKEIINKIKAALGAIPKDTTVAEDKNFTLLCQAYDGILDLQQCAADDTDPKEVFEKLEKVLKDYPVGKSYGLFKAMHLAWLSADTKSRQKACMTLVDALELEFKVTSTLDKIHKNGVETVTGAPTSSPYSFHNFVLKTYLCLLRWKWGSTNNFLYQCSDVKFPDLVSEPVVDLIDAGLAINTPYPLVLRSEREVKLILSFDYSAGDPFETIKKTAKYCEAYRIPFPKIEESKLQDKDNPSDCYIFKGERGPTVMHFPLFNNVNCPGKIEEYRKQFSTFKMSYSKEEIEKLLTAAKKNVTNNKQKILEEIKYIVGPLSSQA